MLSKKKIKFTFPIISLNKGGAQRMLVDISNYLLDQGHDVTILLPKNGINDFVVRSKIIFGKLPMELTEEDFPKSDIIISNFYTLVDPVEQASKNGKGLHVRLSLCYEPVFLPGQNLSFHSYFKTPHLIVLSEYQRNLISLLNGINPKTIPIYIDPIFQDLNIRQNNEELQITSILRMPDYGNAWHRDQDYLVRQLSVVKYKYPDTNINFICPPREYEKSQKLKELKKSKAFNFIIPENDQQLCQIYNQTDIFVTSSVYEAAPLPGLEAMRCGAALVSVYSGGNTEYCRPDENCIMSYRHENRLAFDVISLIKNPALRMKLADQGKKDSELWTLDRSASQFEQICLSFLEQSG